MKISTRGEYGIRALLYLALAGGGRPVSSREIADRQGIPPDYLRQILARLSRASLVSSVRGPGGGHTLGRPADEISLEQVVVCLQGERDGAAQSATTDDDDAAETPVCAIRELLVALQEAPRRILEGTSLGTLARRQREMRGAAAAGLAGFELPEAG